MYITKYNFKQDCSHDEWMCDYGQCLPVAKHCDGSIDCPDDSSDERKCHCKYGYICKALYLCFLGY